MIFPLQNHSLGHPSPLAGTGMLGAGCSSSLPCARVPVPTLQPQKDALEMGFCFLSHHPGEQQQPGGWVDRETQTPLLMLRANIHHPSPESFKASGIKDSEPAVPQRHREFPSAAKPQRPNQRSSRPINPTRPINHTLPINPTPAREALQRRKEGAEDGSDGVWPPLLPEN